MSATPTRDILKELREYLEARWGDDVASLDMIEAAVVEIEQLRADRDAWLLVRYGDGRQFPSDVKYIPTNVSNSQP